MSRVSAVLIALGLALQCSLAHAASLQVAPVIIEVPQRAATSSMQLRNLGSKTLTAQVRVFRWTLQDGADKLVETRDVVISPPLSEITPGSTQLVRIVRVAQQPVQTEESYRILIDEVPEPAGARNSGVTFAVRYSIPVFFLGATSASAPLAWSIEQHAGRITVAASNPGAHHVRIAALRVRGAQGEVMSFGPGLAGYVLAGSMARWSIKGALSNPTPGSTVTILALTNHGPLETTGVVRARR
ncbi:MAG: molecular chaperone [Hyphomonadaceae bacterium]|nr:molecular chaperone [Hyphomonadaceae bacterium]